MSNDCYVLLDAMGIQKYVFETNTLSIIIGSSLALSRWQKTCDGLCSTARGYLITSAGGNVLARFTNHADAEIFRRQAIAAAPPGLEIAWAEESLAGTDADIWKALQRSIGRYKAGDRPLADYPESTPLSPPGCRHCGTRPSDSGKPVKERAICKTCRERHENRPSPGGSTPLETLYRKAESLDMKEPFFPDELDQLVTRSNSSGEYSEDLAVVVVDLNDMGTRIKEIVADPKRGFRELEKFSKQLDDDLPSILSDIVGELAGKESSVKQIRLRPLLVGGDDMAVALPASLWPWFVRNLFAKLKEKKLEAAAGVVVARHTYPINRLTEMAEELVASAKGLIKYRKEHSEEFPDFDGFGLDWHIHQEAGFSSPLAVRKRNYIPLNVSNEVEVATGRPYSYSEFEELMRMSESLIAKKYSTRKLYTLYQGLRSGTTATRDTLVRTFLRNESKKFEKYEEFWRWVDETPGSKPLWTEKDHELSGETKTVYRTRFADLLELTLMGKELHDE